MPQYASSAQGCRRPGGAILASLQERLNKASKALIGNKGYRRHLKVERGSVRIDPEKVKYGSRFDGEWVLRTNTDLPAEQVALKYKELWQVEKVFRDMKMILCIAPGFLRHIFSLSCRVEHPS